MIQVKRKKKSSGSENIYIQHILYMIYIILYDSYNMIPIIYWILDGIYLGFQPWVTDFDETKKFSTKFNKKMIYILVLIFYIGKRFSRQNRSPTSWNLDISYDICIEWFTCKSKIVYIRSNFLWPFNVQCNEMIPRGVARYQNLQSFWKYHIIHFHI